MIAKKDQKHNSLYKLQKTISDLMLNPKKANKFILSELFLDNGFPEKFRLEKYGNSYRNNLKNNLLVSYPCLFSCLSKKERSRLIFDFLATPKKLGPFLLDYICEFGNYVKKHPIAKRRTYLKDIGDFERTLLIFTSSPKGLAQKNNGKFHKMEFNLDEKLKLDNDIYFFHSKWKIFNLWSNIRVKKGSSGAKKPLFGKEKIAFIPSSCQVLLLSPHDCQIISSTNFPKFSAYKKLGKLSPTTLAFIKKKLFANRILIKR